MTRPPAPMAVWVAAFILLAVAAGCSNDDASPTSPTATTPTIAEPSISEDFVTTLGVGGSSFYSFSVTQNGTVNITYTGVSGPGVPGTLWLGVAIGTPSGEGCAATSTVNAPPGGTAQVTGTYAPGVYCAKVSDIGNLFSPATVSVVIAHP